MFKLCCIVAIGAVLGFPTIGLADWELTPSGTYDFGNVEVGTSSTAVFTISNLSEYSRLLVTGVRVLPAGSDYAQTGGPSGEIDIPPTSSVDVEVSFSPTVVGPTIGYLTVTAQDATAQQVVTLNGTGVSEEPPPSETIQDILDFVDAAVDLGTLTGNGPGNSANGRLNALINMIEAAGDLIEAGDFDQAEQQLWDAYKRCDGLLPPPDFVSGPAATELAQIILELIGVLCP